MVILAPRGLERNGSNSCVDRPKTKQPKEQLDGFAHITYPTRVYPDVVHQEVVVAKRMSYVTIRLDDELKAELEKAAGLEGRTLSTFCRLFLEYGWNSYLRAGSLSELITREARTITEEDIKHVPRY